MDCTLTFSALKDIYVCVCVCVCLFSICVCVCLFFIVITIWMPISILGYNYVILTLLFRTCLHTSGVTMVVPNTKLYDV